MGPKRTLAGLFLLGSLLASRSSSVVSGGPSERGPEAAQGVGFVLRPDEGEVLSVPNGEVSIKVDPRTGSAEFALGTQTLRPGAGIGLHVHEHEDEVLFIHRGKGTGLLGDDRRPVETGSAIFIPQGVWHGVENPDGELTLVWVVSPPGLESYFREVGSPPGEARKVLSSDRLEDIRRKHGMRTRPH